MAGSATPDPRLLLEHAGFLRALARSLLLDEGQADDVVQQTLLAAIERPPPDRGNLRGWLATVARNLALRRRRTEGRLRRRHEAAARPEAAPATIDSAARLEVQRLVVDAVRALDEPYRTMVVHRYYDNLGPKEIARRCGLPVETVRTRLKRAVAQLRGRLDAAHDGDRRAWALPLLPLAAAATSAGAATGGGLLLGMTMKTKTIFALALLGVALTMLLYWNAAASARDTGSEASADRAGRATATAATDAGERATADAEPGAAGDGAAAERAFAGFVCARDGAGVGGAQVVIFQREPNGFRRRAVETHADAGGRFAATLSPWRALEVEARHPGFQVGRLWTDEESVEIVLEEAAIVRLHVVGPDGENVPAAAVVVSRVGPFGHERIEERTSDDAGVATMQHLPPERLHVAIDDPRYPPFRDELDLTGRRRFERDLVLACGAVVTGRVFDVAGEPLAGATVHPVDDSLRTARTGADGRYRLRGLAAGRARIMAEAEGFAPGYFGAELGWGRPVELPLRDEETVRGIDIRLGAARFLVGRCVYPDGEPAARIEVHVALRDGFPTRWQGMSGDDGTFRAGPFQVGAGATARLFTNHGAMHFQENAHPFPAAGPLDVGTIEVAPLATLRGVVVDAEGAPVAGALVAGGMARCESRDDGVFQLDGVTHGNVALHAWTDDRSTPALVVRVAGGETVEGLRLAFIETMAVGGRVVTPDGQPRRGVRVGIVADGVAEPHERTQTGADGRFSFDGLAPARYTVGLVDPKDRDRLLGEPAAQEVGPDQTEVEFVAPRTGGIVRGRVVTPDGEPVREFGVWVQRYQWIFEADADYESYTSADGTFTYETKEPGRFTVRVDVDERADVTTPIFKLAAGATHDVGELRLGAGGIVAGRVQDARGQPVAYARVHILGKDFQSPLDAPFTGAEGRFSYPRVEPGVYTVFVVSPRLPLAIRRGVRVAEGKTAGIEITLPEPSPLELVVRDEGGRPLDQAHLVYTFDALKPLNSKSVSSYEPPAWGSNLTDAEGIIRKPTLPAGPLDIVVSRDGFQTESRTIELRPGETTRVEVRLRAR